MKKIKKYIKLFLCAKEMKEIIDTLENDNDCIPDWLWERIKKVKYKLK